VVDQLKEVKWIKVLSVDDQTFMVHQGREIEIKNKIPLNNPGRSVYGVAKGNMAIGHPTPKWALEMRLKIFLWKILK
jgi:hypothetical protein